MNPRRVHCPDCDVLLKIPAGVKSTKVKCAKCSCKFVIPQISDDDIMDVLGHVNRDETSAGPAIDDVFSDMPTDIFDDGIEGSGALAGGASNVPAGLEGLILKRFTQNGVVFEIDSELLADDKIRSAMPKACVRCGSQSNINPRLVVFAHQMLECSAIESEYVENVPTFTMRDVRDKPIRELMQTMPALKKIPAPANKPFPYWVCDMCSPVGLMHAANSIDRKTGKGKCLLQIDRIWRAEMFLVNAGGSGSPAHQLIHKRIDDNPELPWDTLAGAVQQRIKQWFRPHRGEQFVAYTPDRRHSRTEDGMAGLLITNRRLIYHSSRRHFENIKGQQLSIGLMSAAGHYRIRIKGANWEIQQMNVDKSGLERLRRSLIKQKYEAKWI